VADSKCTVKSLRSEDLSYIDVKSLRSEGLSDIKRREQRGRFRHALKERVGRLRCSGQSMLCPYEEIGRRGSRSASRLPAGGPRGCLCRDGNVFNGRQRKMLAAVFG
jgi:hypothetical protein